MITGFQFRAAKMTLGLTYMDIWSKMGVKENTLMRFSYTDNNEYVRANKKNSNNLKLVLEEYGAKFLDNNYISLAKGEATSSENLTCFQFKAARIATGLTQEELSKYIHISSSLISLLEHLDNYDYIDSKRIKIPILKKFFTHLGIDFPNDITVGLKKDPKKILVVRRNS